MDLSTTYLGFRLPHPFMPGASPLADSLDTVRRLEDAGAAAIVMRSLFEEQLAAEGMAATRSMDTPAYSFPEALTYFPDPENFVLGPDEYLEKLRQIKAAVRVPVVASLNGRTPGGWLDYARLMEEAGADALELHIYSLPSDPADSGEMIEARTVEMVAAVKRLVKIPVAAKVSAFYTSFVNMAVKLDATGVDGLVLFNRFYHPDIDAENLEIISRLHLSDSNELPLRLRGLALVSGRVKASLAVTGGVHTAIDAIKATMCGAQAVQMVSALLKHGPEHLRTVREEVARWLETNEYESLQQACGSMSLLKCPDPSPFNRASYMHVLQTWQMAETP